MSRRAQVGGNWTIAICAAVLALAGCGSNGSAGVAFQPEQQDPQPAISGTVYGPDMDGDGIGVYAARSWWHWADQLALIPPAYALQHIAPIASDENVALLQLDATEAGHGSTEMATLVAQTYTKAGGQFTITDPKVPVHPEDVCGLMLVVGSGPQQMRAFVLSHTTNLNAVNEAVVRMVLQRLTEMPPIGLCDFRSTALQTITAAADDAAYSVSASSVAELNDKTFAKIATSTGVQQQIAAVTVGPES